MKLLSPIILLSAALVAVSGADSGNAPQKRDIFDNIGQGIEDAFDNIGQAIGIGHADDPNSTTAFSTTPAPKQSLTSAASTPSSSASVASAGTSRSSSSSSSSQKPASGASKSATSTQTTATDNNDGADTDTADATTSSPSPTPTGEKCSGSDKRCPTVGQAQYQQCVNNVWTNFKCGSSLVCGYDSSKAVACMSSDLATMTYESCSGNSKRCSPTDTTKYQQCNGSYWVNYSCGDSSKCSTDSNKNVVCLSPSDTGAAAATDTYRINTPSAFVPSAAPPPARLSVGAIAAVLAAAAVGLSAFVV